MTTHPRIAARIAALDFAELERLFHFGFAAAACEPAPGCDAMPFVMSAARLRAQPKRVEAVRTLTLSTIEACQALDDASARIAGRLAQPRGEGPGLDP